MGLGALLAACNPPSPRPNLERVAFLTLDNLTSDESLSWMREAVPAIASAQLAGASRILPLRADTAREAALVNATQMVHGYFDQRGGTLHFEFSVEDASSHAMRTVSVSVDALQAADAIAKAFDPSAKAFSTQNLAAAQAWASRNFERATQLDPDFGAAWRDWIQSEVARPALATELAGKALSRSTLKSPIERTQITLLAAQLRGDGEATNQASAELIRLIPNDSALARKLADGATNSRRFQQAVDLYRTVLRLESDDPAVYNLLGYAQFFAGDLDGARKSFDEYSQGPGQAANAFDSQGEVLFMAGQFAEAEKYFRRAHETNSELLQGGDLMKAAYARWLSGDLTGADGIFSEYLKYRSDHADLAVEWRRAGWEFATGREAEAIRRLKDITGPALPLAKAQLQVLENATKTVDSLTRDLAALEQAYKQTPASADGFVRVLYGRELLKAGRKAEAEKLAAHWPLPESGDPSVQPLLYPLYLELKKNLSK